MSPHARLERLLEGARALADPKSEIGAFARDLLPALTRLSPEGVELALSECLEIAPSEAELEELLTSVRPSPRTLVSLPSNVFVAAHRAVALAVAASETVLVRPSRREPRFLRLLAMASPELFDIATVLSPEPGDTLWAYGGAETLASLRSRLPAGVELHAQGPGYGVAVVGRAHVNEATALALARDIVPFDQRGCLSPLVALVVGDPDDGMRFAALVAAALDGLARTVPLGTLHAEELADAARFRDTAAYAGQLFPAGPGSVACVPGAPHLTAPVGRNLAVITLSDPAVWLCPVASEITALGLALPDDERRRLTDALPQARASAVGAMQRPRFDGPADRRRAPLASPP